MMLQSMHLENPDNLHRLESAGGDNDYSASCSAIVLFCVRKLALGVKRLTVYDLDMLFISRLSFW